MLENAAERVASEGTYEGLASMQARLTELGGEFHLRKLSGAGTRIELAVPLGERLELSRRQAPTTPPEEELY